MYTYIYIYIFIIITYVRTYIYTVSTPVLKSTEDHVAGTTWIFVACMQAGRCSVFERKKYHILSNCASATGCKNVLCWKWNQFNKSISSYWYPTIESPSFISELRTVKGIFPPIWLWHPWQQTIWNQLEDRARSARTPKKRAMAFLPVPLGADGYKFPAPDLADWPETPETKEILQRLKTIQRLLDLLQQVLCCHLRTGLSRRFVCPELTPNFLAVKMPTDSYSDSYSDS